MITTPFPRFTDPECPVQIPRVLTLNPIYDSAAVTEAAAVLVASASASPAHCRATAALFLCECEASSEEVANA